MAIDPREKLAGELMPSEWRMLAMHYRRDALFVIAAELPLIEAAAAVATDDAPRVRAWIEGGQIARPTEHEVEAWSAESGTRFISVIVQPYVLAQRVEHFAGDAS